MKQLILNILMLFFLPVSIFAQTPALNSTSSVKPKDRGASQTAVDLKKAYFAGGCFWCMEPPFEKLKGVLAVTSGYMGGTKKNPTYEEVSSHKTGHLEIVEVQFDAKVVSFEVLLELYWQQIDPTDPNGQFVDQGDSYLSAIFYVDEGQKKSAEASKKKIVDSKKFNKPIVTTIRPAAEFYPAEDYHQDYYKKNPIRYKYYRSQSGRDAFLKKYWP